MGEQDGQGGPPQRHLDGQPHLADSIGQSEKSGFTKPDPNWRMFSELENSSGNLCSSAGRARDQQDDDPAPQAKSNSRCAAAG